MKIRLLLIIVGLAVNFALPTFTQQTNSTPEATTPTPGDNFGQILPDRRVMFRLIAPNATDVKVIIGVKSDIHESQGTTTTEMTKDLFGAGLWTVTLGPFEPNLYDYSFDLDGLTIADPGNPTPRPEWKVDTSLLLVPGNPLLDTQNVAHGTLHEETYYSTFLAK